MSEQYDQIIRILLDVNKEKDAKIHELRDDIVKLKHAIDELNQQYTDLDAENNRLMERIENA